MKFDFVIGNPPYQDETVGNQKQFAPPVYDRFLDEAYKIGNKVEMIHPARFLYNAGGTSKAWNEKMLGDDHLKVIFHEQDSSKVFSNTDIKGGIVVTYRDASHSFGSIGTYTKYPELNSILAKVISVGMFRSIEEIMSNRGLYRFSQKAYIEHPEEMAKISDSRIGASAFERMPKLFTDNKPSDGKEYVMFFGLEKGKRVYKWFNKEYFNPVESFGKYKLMFSAANGSGVLGEVLSLPEIGKPFVGHTETYMRIGSFDTEGEAKACFKYVCTKFARTMLGILKITQHNSPEKWKYVPLQDFSSASDINWDKPVRDIDKQLYNKYGLSNDEISFIETHVKEMA